MQEWVIQIPSIPILSFSIPTSRIKFLLLVKIISSLKKVMCLRRQLYKHTKCNANPSFYEEKLKICP